MSQEGTAGTLGATSGLREFCISIQEELLRVLTLHCGDRLLAEELTQEALARVCARWERVRKMDSPRGWTFRVAFNLANSTFRRRQLERNVRDQRSQRIEESDTASAIAVRQALGQLPDRLRAVLVLRFYLDLSVREVAELLDLPEGTVKTLTHRGVRALRATEEAKEFREAGYAQ